MRNCNVVLVTSSSHSVPAGNSFKCGVNYSSLFCSKDQGKEYVGCAALLCQVQRKAVKKGFEFTLMVVGKYTYTKKKNMGCLKAPGSPGLS